MNTICSPSRLRTDLYRLLDRVLETGLPLEVDRNGRRLRIVPAEPGERLGNLIHHPGYLEGDPDEIVHLDWSDEWLP